MPTAPTSPQPPKPQLVENGQMESVAELYLQFLIQKAKSGVLLLLTL